MNYTQLLDTLSPDDDGGHKITVAQDWMQGRTFYGGLSAALCLAAVTKQIPDLPPLRSGLVSFIGPAGGTVSLQSEILRQGKSVTFTNTDLVGEKGLATRCNFCFGAARKSQFDLDFIKTPDVPSPSDSQDHFAANSPFAPAFTKQFDLKLAKGAQPYSGSDENDHYFWIRHKDQKATDLTALLAIADMPPPAMMAMFTELSMISSMTWMVNILEDNVQTNDGWYLLQSRAEHARAGYSSQDMVLWNSAGKALMTARQNVAIFT